MRAVVFDRHGGPDVLHCVRVAKPRPVANEVLVRVHACGLNHGLDGRTRENGAGRAVSFPHILGTEIVGEVEAVDSNADPALRGSKVVVSPWRVCGACDACRSGEDDQCASRMLRGIDLPGGYAEYVTARTDELIFVPDESPPIAGAAALPISYTTAWHMLVRRAKLRAGETVLVLGAAGTIGIAATQIAVHAGAHVLAVASSNEKLRVAEANGAATLINYAEQDVVEQVRRATGGRGVDVVVEHTGASTWNASLESLALSGRLAICGATTGWNLSLDARRLWRKNITLHFCNSGIPQDVRAVVDLWARGELRPVIARTFALEDAAKAHEMLSDRKLIGKIVLLHEGA